MKDKKAKESGSKSEPKFASQSALRVDELRKLMSEQGLSAFVLLYGSAHHAEYIAPHLRRLESMSGFSGSAGTIVIGLKEAHLWVDSRYYLQAEDEVPSFFEIHKLGSQGVKSWQDWLIEDFAAQNAGARIGGDAFQMSVLQARKLRSAFESKGCVLKLLPENLVDVVCKLKKGRSAPLRTIPISWSGKPAQEKLKMLRAEMEKINADALVLSKLDRVAWMLNLRGGDMPMDPVFEGWLLLTKKNAICFTDAPAPSEVETYAKGWLSFRPYQDLKEALVPLATKGAKVWLEEADTCEAINGMLKGATCLYQPQQPVDRWKAIKNPSEIACSKAANISAGLAKVRLFAHLETTADELSEADVADMMQSEYAREAGFESLSFETICGYGANAAIVHYSKPSKDVLLKPGGMLLLDSGIQLGGGTTDDTRTVHIGTPTEELRRYYTAVLRAHINLAKQIVPEGVTGAELDGITRTPLWNIGEDYGHGTGHGVGAMLHVHEGPQSIGRWSSVPFEEGMIISNEPGYYREGWGGIRLENLYLVEKALEVPTQPNGKGWLKFSALTMTPFDNALIDWLSLTKDEKQWLQGYHQLVYNNLSDKLPPSAKKWLQKSCSSPT